MTPDILKPFRIQTGLVEGRWNGPKRPLTFPFHTPGVWEGMEAEGGDLESGGVWGVLQDGSEEVPGLIPQLLLVLLIGRRNTHLSRQTTRTLPGLTNPVTDPTERRIRPDPSG